MERAVVGGRRDGGGEDRGDQGEGEGLLHRKNLRYEDR
jgi:hypothetical protein